jgi:formylglycine-generating enzyme required for sulfatase activity
MKSSLKTLLQELGNIETTHERRQTIGETLEKLGDSRPGVGVKDGIPDLLWLPVFPGGNVNITRHWLPDTPSDKEKRSHVGTFKVASFYIAKYPVTFAQYQAFVEAEDGYSNLAWWQGIPKRNQHQELATQRTKRQNNPRDTISWYQSIAFGRWLNHKLHGLELPHPTGNGVIQVGNQAHIRLPTEWEWQWAAQNGVERRPYPANTPNPKLANTAESGLGQAIAVGMYPHGAAACGALDMAGNLMEWCANDKENPKIIDVKSTVPKVLRGGDWGYGIENAACTYCDDEEPTIRDALNGFRLVLSTEWIQSIE